MQSTIADDISRRILTEEMDWRVSWDWADSMLRSCTRWFAPVARFEFAGLEHSKHLRVEIPPKFQVGPLLGIDVHDNLEYALLRCNSPTQAAILPTAHSYTYWNLKTPC